MRVMMALAALVAAGRASTVAVAATPVSASLKAAGGSRYDLRASLASGAPRRDGRLNMSFDVGFGPYFDPNGNILSSSTLIPTATADAKHPIVASGGRLCGPHGYLVATVAPGTGGLRLSVDGAPATAVRRRPAPRDWHYRGTIVLAFVPSAYRRAVLTSVDLHGHRLARVTGRADDEFDCGDGAAAVGPTP
jgi:hypothetical protein